MRAFALEPVSVGESVSGESQRIQNVSEQLPYPVPDAVNFDATGPDAGFTARVAITSNPADVLFFPPQ